jgi:ketosteroid isomerase-like protein
MEERNSEVVRLLWGTTHRRGIKAALDLVEPDVGWSLYFVPGVVFSTEELCDFLLRLQGDRQLLAAQMLRLKASGDCVLASGSFRWGSVDGGLSDFQGHWLYEFEGGRLVRGTSFRALDEAVVAFEGAYERSEH